jgi:hypothetical protein
MVGMARAAQVRKALGDYEMLTDKELAEPLWVRRH